MATELEDSLARLVRRQGVRIRSLQAERESLLEELHTTEMLMEAAPTWRL